MLAIRLLVLWFLALIAAAQPALAQEPPPQEEAKARVKITVVDEDGVPIEGASVSLDPSEAERKELAKNGFLASLSATTDEDGLAGLEFPPNEARTILARATRVNGESKAIELEPLGPGELEEITVTLRIRDDARFTGIAVDASTGRPIRDAAVTASSVSKMMALSSRRSRSRPGLRRPLQPAATSDDRGSFTVSAAKWRKTEIVCHAEGYAVRTLIVGGTDDAEGLGAPMRVALEPECRVQVQLFDPPEDVEIYAEVFALEFHQPDAEFNTHGALDYKYINAQKLDDSDTYVIGMLPANTSMTIKAEVHGKLLAEQTSVGVGKAGTETRIVMDLSEGGDIDVIVLAPDGTPVRSAELWYGPISSTIGQPFRSYEKPQGKIRTDAEGRASIEGLRAGVYRVSLAPVQGRQALDAVIAPSATARIDGSGAAIDVVIQQVQGLTIEGMLLDPDGQPASSYIYASRTGPAPSMTWSADLQSREVNGKFVLGPLIPGEYRVAAMGLRSGDATSSTPVQASAGDRGVNVQLRAAGSIRGTIKDAITGEPVLGSEFYAHDSGTSSWSAVRVEPDGSFHLDNLAVGKHHLLARTEDGRISDWIDVEIQRGQELGGVEVLLKRQGILVLTCDDRSGLPPRPINYSIFTERGRWYVSTMSVGETRRLPVPVGKVRLELGRLELKQRVVQEFDFEAGQETKYHGRFDPPRDDTGKK